MARRDSRTNADWFVWVQGREEREEIIDKDHICSEKAVGRHTMHIAYRLRNTLVVILILERLR